MMSEPDKDRNGGSCHNNSSTCDSWLVSDWKINTSLMRICAHEREESLTMR
jgi:hypothetical protein